MQELQKPGPKPLQYIPAPMRTIEGIETVTTRQQLQRLKAYLETPLSRRPPYVRLGASVPQYGLGNTRRPSATYAVTVHGTVRVFRKMQDPRAVERWVRNPSRPWNLEREFAGMEID